MNNHHQIIARVLNELVPAQALIHVGAGEGTGPLAFWHQWPLEFALAIDAQEKRLQGWHPGETVQSFLPLSAILAEEEQEVHFQLTSNPDHAGLLNAKALRGLWPNLRDQGTLLKKAILLDSLTAEISNKRFWVIIECFSAINVLTGGHNTLTNTQVAFVRVVLKEPIEPALRTSWIEVVDERMFIYGFKRVEIIVGVHPDIADAVYVCDMLAESVKKSKEIETVFQSFEQEREQFEWERNAQAKQVKEQQAQIVALTNAKDEQVQLASELKKQIDVLQGERQKIEQERNVQAKLAQERQTQIEILKKQIEEFEFRCFAYNEEVIRIEAQMELIKELLLRDTGL